MPELDEVFAIKKYVDEGDGKIATAITALQSDIATLKAAIVALGGMV